MERKGQGRADFCPSHDDHSNEVHLARPKPVELGATTLVQKERLEREDLRSTRSTPASPPIQALRCCEDAVEHLERKGSPWRRGRLENTRNHLGPRLGA